VTGNRWSDLPGVIEPVHDEGAHIRWEMVRTVVWPQVRGNATWLIPAPRADWELGLQICPHCGKGSAVKNRTLWEWLEVCDYRPDYVVDNYEDRCETCGHPIAYHGILDVRFCVECSGPLRFLNQSARFSSDRAATDWSVLRDPPTRPDP
jgi:hypothetical protein